MFSFTGAQAEAGTREQGLLVAETAWDEYYGSLTEAFVLTPPVKSEPTEETEERRPDTVSKSEPSKYQPSLYSFFKLRAEGQRPIATPMQQLLGEVNAGSPSKRRWVGAQQRRDEQLKKAQEKTVLLGDRVQALPGTGLIEGEVEFYKAGDQGTVEELEADENGAERFVVEWDRTGEKTFMLQSNHIAAPKFKVIGKADFVIGKLVQRRDHGRDWGLGYVTCTKPLLVSVLDTPGARGYEWDEVRQVAEVEELEDDNGCQTPLHDDNGKPVTPTPDKARKKRKISNEESQLLARVRKDASIAYLREDANVKFLRHPGVAR